jgi:transporter family-2 protein
LSTTLSRRRGPSALLATPPRAVAVTILAGGMISLQSYLNGRLGRQLDSATVASAINNLVAMLAALAVVLATGALPRAIGRLRAHGRPSWWQFSGGLFGAALVLIATAAAPEVGVALLTVALVCGSTTGSVAIDAAGLAPAGRLPVTPARIAGVLLAVAATVIGALGARGELQPLLLGLALVGGAGMAVQSAANGRLGRATGEPFVASLTNSTLGLAVLAVVAAITLATHDVGALPASPALYLGGLLGAFVVVVSLTAVQTLGVLRLGLATVAGQTAGALVIDLIAPAPGEVVTAGTVIGVALTLVAVLVSGRGRRAR